MTISVVFGRRYLPASADDMKTENNTLQIFARENKHTANLIIYYFLRETE